MIFSTQADTLAQLCEQKRISKEEYLQRLNGQRQKVGLPPVATGNASPKDRQNSGNQVPSVHLGRDNVSTGSRRLCRTETEARQA